jgi:hypothetical protein
MNVLIQISPMRYDVLTGKCQRDSAEFAILMRGIIVEHSRHGKIERMVKIRSELGEAKLLLALAAKVYPDAVSEIQKAIDESRQS